MNKQTSASYEGTSGASSEEILDVEIVTDSPGSEDIVDTRINKGFFTFNGKGRINARGTDSTMRSSDNVVASITEIDGNGRPFLGNADVKVYGVAPFDGGVVVRADLVWGSNINCKIMLHW